MKNMKKLLGLSLLTLAGTMSLASCGSIFKGNEGMMISNITHTLDKDGNTVITINFTDEDLEPVTFTIPKGEQGETGMSGVGIEDVTWAPLEDGTGLEVTFSFTDEEMPDKVIEIPYATGIENIEAVTDPETGATKVTITTTDGQKTEFTLNPAVGISDVQTSVDEESNAVIITITYTGGKEPTTITIPYKNGEDGKDGKGISFITGTVVGDQYYIDIYYDDEEGTSDTIVFDAPKSGTIWYTGNQNPSNMQINANDGDFYFDIQNLRIYRYQGGTWVLIAQLENDETTYVVTFDPNGGSFTTATSTVREVKKGSYINDLPEVYKEGHSFIGWWTSPNGPSSPNSGHFTDITPVFGNLTLYACFEEITQ